MEFKYQITVFTPTYNRAYILENLYRSLQRQTFQRFEWLIVDDGSADGTEDLVKKWQTEENSFPIRYVWQENGGKCRAINHGLDLAAGELFFTVDSDDYLTDDALEKVARWDAELPKNQKYCGFVGNRGTTPEDTPNRLFEGGYLDGFMKQLENSFPMPSVPEMGLYWEAMNSASKNIWNGADVQKELDACNAAITGGF